MNPSQIPERNDPSVLCHHGICWGCWPPMAARRRAEASKEGVHLSTSTFWPPWIGHPKWWGLVRESKPERIGNKAKRIAFHLIWRMSSAKMGLRFDGGKPKRDDKGMTFTHCVHMAERLDLGMTLSDPCRSNKLISRLHIEISSPCFDCRRCFDPKSFPVIIY